jgi:hypothetical protein
MKVIVLVIRMFLFGEVEEEATFIYPTMEECMREKEKKEGELVGFPIERVEGVCELQDRQTEPPPVECLPLVPRTGCNDTSLRVRLPALG